MRHLLPIGIAFLLLPVVADASLLCTTKNHTVKIRDACRAKETPLDTAGLGLVGPPGPPGPGLTVKDANGVFVGVADASVISVARRVGPDLLLFWFDASGFLDYGSLWYVTSDCTGQPYIDKNSTGGGAAKRVIRHLGTYNYISSGA